MTPNSPRLRRRIRSIVAFSIFALLLLAAASLIDVASQALLTPWSVTLAGRPALTGEWIGEVAVTESKYAVLYLLLERAPDDDGPNLDGAARYCIAGQHGDFDVWGNADRAGRVDDLRLRPEEEAPLWLLHEVSSEWRGDRLTLAGHQSYDPSGQHIARSGQPEPSFVVEMQRGGASEFDRLCAADGVSTD